MLESENKLKLYQVHVRVSLLSEVTAKQRQRARNFASEKREEAQWRGDVMENGDFDTLLPKPFWFRSRASELGVDAKTRDQIERTHQAAEPKYHELKANVKPLVAPLREVLLAETLDEKKIVKRMAALLEAESRLKLYQVRVRTSLLSQVTAKQRQLARSLAKQKTEADWRKVMSEKVERVRELSKGLSDQQSVSTIKERMKSRGELTSLDVFKKLVLQPGEVRDLGDIVVPTKIE